MRSGLGEDLLPDFLPHSYKGSYNTFVSQHSFRRLCSDHELSSNSMNPFSIQGDGLSIYRRTDPIHSFPPSKDPKRQNLQLYLPILFLNL